MPKLTSQEIGIIFEKATSQILILMFKEWGYDAATLEVHVQNSGSQFGFDIYFKLTGTYSLPTYIYIECKGSKSFNEIGKQELITKSDQLKRSFHAVKDVHIFFSPTRAVKYANDEEQTIENNDYPFCILNMMGNSEPNEVLNLFMSYDGNHQDIIDYKEKILNPLVPNFKIDDDFKTIASRLQKRFDARISEYLSVSKNNEFQLLTSSYWKDIYRDTDYNRLPDYYLRTDTGTKRLLEVVANDYYVVNKSMTKDFLKKFSEIKKKKHALIKILSNGGEGKSTFLLHIGKELCVKHPVFFIEKWVPDLLNQIKQCLNLMKSSECPVLLLDNASTFELSLEEYGAQIANFKNGLIMVLAERHYRYNHMEIKESFEFNFAMEAVAELKYSSKNDHEAIFKKFYKELKDIYPELDDQLKKQKGKQLFTKFGKYTIAERIYETIKFYHENYKINFKFDWDEWELVNTEAPLKNLYVLVAAFYQFGNRIDLNICSSFSDFYGIRSIDIRNAIDQTPHQPIIRDGDVLRLRHEKIAEWCILEKKQKDNVRGFYKEWIEHIDSPLAKNLFLWTYRNRDFQSCPYLLDLLPPQKVIKVLNNFIEDHNEEINARTELGKVYQDLGKWEDAERVLKEGIQLEPEGIHCRTELGKVFQHQKKWKEAENILKEAILLEPAAIHSRNELGKVYQHLEKWAEAEKVLKKALHWDPKSVHVRTELGKVYQHLERWEDAEIILQEAISLQSNTIHSRTELGKVYQHSGKWLEAEEVLKKAISLDKENKFTIHTRTELGKVYQHLGKWDDAQRILKEILTLDKDNLHTRTELAKVYQHLEMWKAAEKTLKEVLVLDKDNIHTRTELGKIYQHLGRWNEAEKILKKAIAVAPKAIHSRTELGKVYQHLKKWAEAENILQEAIWLDKDNRYTIHTRTELGKVYQQLGKWKDAEEILEEAITLDRENKYTIHTRTELGKVYQYFKKWKLAEDILTEAVKIDPKAIHSRTELGKVYQQLGKWKEAEQVLQQAILLDDKVIHSRTELGKVYQHFERWREAEKVLTEALKLDKNNRHVIVELAITYVQNNKTLEGITLLKDLIKKFPKNLHARTQLAKIYRSKSFYDKAIQLLEEVIDLQHDNFYALNMLASIYATQRKRSQKEKVLFQIFKIKPDNTPTLVELGKVFTRFRKYHIAFELYEKAYISSPKNLYVIIALMGLCKKMNNLNRFSELKEIGIKLIEYQPGLSGRSRFESLIFEQDYLISLVQLKVAGIYNEAEQIIKMEDNKKISIVEMPELNYNIANGKKVVFAMYYYHQNKEHIANFIEPFYKNIDNLESLK